MKIKKNDKVKVIQGNDRGKQGRVLRVFPKEKKILVEGVNLKVKHVASRREGEKGQRIRITVPISISNVKLICPKCGKAIRVGYKVLTDKSKQRYCRRCQNVF